jgi:predicted ester cyclase
MSEENKALVRRWFTELDKGNDHIVDELVAIDYIDHNPPLPDMAPGREGVKQANALLRAAFPDARHAIEDQIAEGDKVVTRLNARATFQGAILGIPPNGKLITVEGISIHRIAGGQFVEHWAVGDNLSLYQQLGAIPPLKLSR